MIEVPGYTVQRSLGRGGMAVVYLATQESLGRDVALKVLSPSPDDSAGERFLREARIAASLHHPHIVPIFDFGVHEGHAFIAMQYLADGTMSPPAGERLEPRAALRCVRDIASALDYAHSRGIVHRDIKPDNILRGPDGAAVLSDFGIARLIQGESVLTSEGTSVGTPHYMSPEQLRGEKVDGRSDIYSLGVVLWQLLTGELPYKGSDAWAIGTQHLGAEIPRLPPGLGHLQGLVDLLMAKRVEQRPANGLEVVRHIDALLATSPSTPPASVALMGSSPPTLELSTSQTAAEPRSLPAKKSRRLVAAMAIVLALALAWLGWREFDRRAIASQAAASTMAAAPKTQPPSVAVLPFEDLSEAHDQSYFSDGMSDEVSNRLGGVSGLRVAGRTSAQSFKGKSVTIAEIGKILNVASVLEGSVRRSGDRLRISVQLSNAADGFQLWSQSYDRKLTDVFAVQDEIAGAVVEALKLKLLSVSHRNTPSVEAYDQYLRGNQFLIRSGRENSKLALASFRKAVALDPEFASAYAGLAMAENFMAPGPDDPKGSTEARQRAMAAAERAVALDPGLGEGYSARGFLRRLAWDWIGALADADQSVALSPSDGRSHLRRAVALESVNRLPEAQAAVERAIVLEPFLTPAWYTLSRVKLGRGDYKGAREAFRRIGAIDPGFQNDSPFAGRLLLLEGKPAEARALLAKLSDTSVELILADHDLGKRAEARQTLDRLAAEHGVPAAYELATGYAWIGQTATALDWLERAYATHSGGMQMISYDPMLRRLRGEPRFRALLRKLGLPEQAG